MHGLDEIIRFRMLMIAAGYEDGNDTLRSGPLLKLVMDRLPAQPRVVVTKRPIRPAEPVPAWCCRRPRRPA